MTINNECQHCRACFERQYKELSDEHAQLAEKYFNAITSNLVDVICAHKNEREVRVKLGKLALYLQQSGHKIELPFKGETLTLTYDEIWLLLKENNQLRRSSEFSEDMNRIAEKTEGLFKKLFDDILDAETLEEAQSIAFNALNGLYVEAYA
jgi:hypothetical protein